MFAVPGEPVGQAFAHQCPPRLGRCVRQAGLTGVEVEQFLDHGQRQRRARLTRQERLHDENTRVQVVQAMSSDRDATCTEQADPVLHSGEVAQRSVNVHLHHGVDALRIPDQVRTLASAIEGLDNVPRRTLRAHAPQQARQVHSGRLRATRPIAPKFRTPSD